MTTPTDKAQELVDKFKDYVHGYVGSSMLINHEYPEQILSQARKVATIVVDEILQDVRYGKERDWVKERSGAENTFTYWQEVKSEIENTK